MNSRRQTFLRLGGAFLIALSVMPVALDGGLDGDVAEAEEIEAFAEAYSTNANGAIDSIGNALLTCGTSANCVNTLNGTRNSGNGSFTMVFDDADDAVLPAAISAQTTSSSSRATLAMPAGSTVLYAGLYWSAQSNSGSRNRLDFLVPGGAAYVPITGQVDAAGSLYQARADVTALVAAAGNGDYWGGDIQAITGRNTYAAWSMVVVYENPALPTRNLSVFEGFGRVTSSFRTLDVPISGFLTPPFGNVNAEIGVIAYEGDRNIPGDQVLIDTNAGAGTTFTNLSDASNPTTNFGNGSISDAGVADLTGLPSTVNNLSVDIDEFATTNLLENAQTDTTVRFQTQGDFWYPGVLTTAIDLFVPEFPDVVKTVVDRNGGDAIPGDILDYTVSFTNTGNDAAIDSIVTDMIPTDTTYLPNSIRVNGVGQTDAANTGLTDYGDFTGSEIVARIGTGATGTDGGTLIPDASAEVEFSVTIDPSARGTDIENQARLDYTALTINEPFTFITNEVVTPVPPLADLSITKSASPNPAVPGTDLVWTIEIDNAGPNTATDVVLTDTLPAGVTFDSVTGATCTGTTTLTCDVADIAAGSSQTVVITTPVDPGVANGTYLQNSANVTLAEEDARPWTNSTIAGVSARSAADLSITKSDDADPVAIGDTITYTVVATNAGPSTATDVRVSDNPDGATTPVSVSATGGTGTVTCNQGARSCTVPALEAGDSLTMTVVVDVEDYAGSSVTNAAFVQSPVPDPDTGNNNVTEPTAITPIADITVTKTTPSAPLVAGETVTYHVLVENDGPSPAAAVTMTDTLDGNLDLISVASPVGTCSGDPAISCDLGTLGAGASVNIVITATVAADANGATIANTATVATTTDEGANALPNTSTVNDTVTNSSDLRIVKEVGSNDLVVGGPFDYTLTVTNDGPSETDAVATITDEIPAELTLDTPAPAGCSFSGQDVTCLVPAGLAVGDSATFVLTGEVGGAEGIQIANTAEVDYPNDPNAANDSSTATTQLVTEADVRLDKEWVDASVVAGGDATFTLTVANDGLSPALDVDVTDSIPNGTIVSATPTTGTCAGVGTDALDCDLGTMLNGAAETITVVVTIDADAPSGDLLNTASTSSTTADRNPDNNSDTDIIAVARSADLTVSKVANDLAPLAGDTITYTVEITNLGPSTATASFLGDALPTGLDFVPGSFTVSGAPNAPATPCTVPGGVITCDLGELPVSATPAVITYDVVIDPSVDPGPVTNTATATSTTPDPTPATDDETVIVDATADLNASKTVSPTIATPGGSLTYTIEIGNDGPSDARLVVVDDAVPAGFTVTSATSTQGSCDLTVSCALGTLAPGNTVEITVVGDVDSGFADATISNTAVVSSATDDPNDPANGTDDNTATAIIPVEPRADLSITKSASPTTIDAGGGQVTFDIGVANVGPSDATNVSVTDTLPAGFVVDSITPSQGLCTAFPCDLGTVAAGQAPAVITVIGHFPGDVLAGTVSNAVTVASADVIDPDPSNDAASVDVDVTTAADVTVAKSGPDSVVAGDVRIEDPANPGSFTGGATYTIAVSNDGPSAATGVVLADTLDASLLDVSNVVLAVSPAGACTPTNASGVIGCDIGDLAVGELVTLTITADVRADAPAGVDTLVNSASVATTTADPDPSNDTSLVESDVTQSADLAIEKTKATNSAFGATNTQFVAGETLSYELAVTNNGPSDASNVVISDDPPTAVALGTVTSAPAGCTALPCTVPDLAVGETIVVTVEATVAQNTNSTVVTNEAAVTSDTADGNPSNNDDDITNGVVRRADMELVSKTSTPDPVVAGQDISYTIIGRNNGPSTARGAVITDTVPADTTLVSASLPSSCTTTGTAPGSTITCVLGDLPSGSESTRSFSVTVDPDASGSISNTATASSDTTQPTIGVNDPDATLDDDKVETTAIGGEADLGITKSAAPNPAVPGESLTYTVTVTNAGPSTARDVVVIDDVTGIFDGAVTVTPAAGVTCDLTVTCDPFDLPVGTATFTIAGTAAAATTAPISNTATVSSATPEPADATLPNSATISTPIDTSADLIITKVDDVATTVDPTGTIEYTIVVTNDGPSDAQAVVISDVLPVEVESPTVTSTPAGCTALPCTVPTIAAGADVTLTVTGTISDRAVGTISNTATVTSDTPDPDTDSNTATETTAITPVADVGVTKTLNTSPLIAGETARYTLVVSNNGPAIAEDVVFTEALPAGVTFTAISSPIGTCDAAPIAGEISCDLGDLNDQASVTILVDVLVGEATTANLVNTASVTTTTVQPAGGGNPDSATTDSPVTVNADVEVKKSLVEDSILAGGPFTYQIEITNNGPSAAQQPITLTDVLPLQIDPLVPIVLSNTDDCGYDAVTREVSCTFADDLAVGAAPIVLTISGEMQSGIGAADDNTVTISTPDDPNTPDNNTSSASADIEFNADLSSTKVFDDASVIAGESTTFTMTIANAGPSDATDVFLTDTLPAGMTAVSATPTPLGGGCDISDPSVISCDIGTLVDAGSVSVNVVVDIDPDAAAGPLNNSTVASSATPDRNPENNIATDGIQVVREADISITKDASATSVLAGNQITYTIGYRNDGPSTAEASVIGDALPADTTFVLPLPANCTGDAGILDCDLGTIAPMDPADPDVTFTYTVLVDEAVADNTDLVNTANISSITPPPGGVAPAPGTATVGVATESDVELLSKDATPDPVVAGEVVTYTIAARNDGPSLATNMTIVDDFPASLTPVTPLPAGCTIVGGDLSCNVGDIPTGDTVTVVFNATVGADEPAGVDISNTASVSADPDDPTPANNSVVEDVAVIAEADISITKTATPSPAVPGEAITYEIVVTNDGSSDAQSVVVSDPVPAGVTFTSATASDGSTCTTEASCDLGVLDAGETVTITIVGTVLATTTAPIVNEATVTSPTPPSATGPARTDSITTPVEPVADLAIAKSISPVPPVPGEAVQFTITVTNPGPSAAQNVVVTDTIDPAVTSLATASAGCSITDQALLCTTPTLSPGTKTIVVSGVLAADFVGDLANTATLTTDTPQGPNASPDSATVTETVAPEADVAITKTAAPDPVIAGESLTYTLSVVNNGPSVATGVVVDDVVPAGFDVSDITSSVGDCVEVPCTIGTLAVGQTETVMIEGTVDADITDLDPNTGTVTATTVDSTPGNNSDEADPVVDESASLTTTKVLTSPADGSVVPGESVTWEIVVSNDGPSDALDVEVDDAVPAFLTGVTVTSVPAGCTAFPCDIGTLESAASVTITVTGDVPSSTPAGDLVNAAATSSSTPDPDLTDNNPVATNPIVPSADLVIEKAGPLGDVTPGTEVTYVLTVTNNGPSDADAVVIADTLPAAFDPATITEVSPTADCTITGMDISCTQPILEDQQVSTVTITGTVTAGFVGADVANTATVSSDTPDPDPVSNKSTGTNPAVPEADLAITKQLVTPADGTPVPGAPVAYEIVVSNPGPSDSVNVVVTDTVDPAVTNLVATPAECSFTGQDLSCTFGVLAAGDDVTIGYAGDLASNFVGSLDNTVSVVSDTPQGANASPDSAMTSDPVAAVADLSITKVANPDPVVPGGPVTYTIAVANAGPSDALDVEIVDTPPADITIDSIGADVAATCDVGTATCDIASVPAGTTVTVTIEATVSTSAVGSITNDASVDSTTTDPTPNDHDASATAAVTPYADLGVDKTFVLPAGGPVAGTPARYRLAVTNDGPATAVDVVLTDTLPAGTTLVSTSTPFGSCTETGGVVTCELGDILSGTSFDVLIDVDVAANQSADLVNSAAIDSATVIDPNAANDSDSTTNPVQVSADLSITKRLVQPSVVAGDPATYELVVTNNGPSTSLETITIDDPLPAEMLAGTVVLSDNTNCSLVGGQVSCAFAGELASGDSITLTITGETDPGAASLSPNTATVSTIDDPAIDQVDPDAGNNTATAIGDLTVNADLVASKVFDDASVIAGLSTSFTISVVNNGPSTATNVTLVDNLPTGMTVASVVATGGTCTAPVGGSSIDCGAATLAPAATLSAVVIVDIDVDQPAGPVSNVVTTDSDVDDRNPSSNIATDSIRVTREADLRITKESDVATQDAGDDVDFTIEVRNLGPSSAEASVLGDALPDGMTIDVASIVVTGAPNFAGCTTPGGTLACDLGVLPPTPSPGTPVTIEYTVSIDPDVAPGTQLTNAAQISSPTPLPDPTNPPTAEVDVEVTGSADLAAMKSVDPTNPVAGTDAEYTITVVNNGPSQSTDAQVVDTLPAGVTLDASSLLAGCTVDAAGTVITCELGDLTPSPEPGSTAVVTYTVTIDADQTVGTTLVNDVTASSPVTPDPVAGNEDADATIAVDTSVDLSITKVAVGDAPVEFVPGEPIEWLITVTNDGPSDAAAVTVADTLRSDITDVVVTPSIGSCTAFPCDLGIVPAGGSATISVTGDLPADAVAGDLDNIATVMSTTDDPNVGNDSATATTPIVPSADLQIIKSAAPSPFVPGEEATYTIVVSNNGPSDADAVVVTDRLPAAIDLATVSIVDGGATCTATPLASRDVTCTIATLADGADVTIEITGDVIDTVIADVSNTAGVSTTTPDPTPGNDSSTTTTPVAPVADIGISKVIVTPVVVPGSLVEFEIAVANNGPSAAQDVVVTDTLPAEYTSVASSTPNCSVVGNTVTCLLGEMSPGSETITVTGILDSAHTGPTSNTAGLTTTTTQTGTTPDSATVAGSTVPSADLALTKTATPATVTAGEDVTYLIEVDNLGPSDALDVVVSDTLPAGLTLVSVASSQGDCTALPCALGTIAAGGDASVTVVATLDSSATTLGLNSASVDSTTADPTAANNSDTAAPAVETRADLTTTKVLTTPTAVPGEPLRWVIEVTNPGPSDALDVVVADDVPTEVTVTAISASAGYGPCAAFPCTLGTVAAGDTAQIFIDADVPSDVVGNTIENQAGTTSSTPDGTPLDNDPIASNPIAPAADLRIAKSGPAADVVAGTAVSWTLTIDNDGPSDSLDVVITDDLPAAVDPATVVVTSTTATCGATGLAVECTQASLADGGTITVTIDAVLRADFLGSLDNTASVTSLSTTDLDPTDNVAVSNNTNVPLADVSITGTATPDPVAAGTSVDFEFVIANDGPSDAAGTVVTIPLPASIALDGVPTLVGAPAGATVTVVDGQVIVDLGSLPPGTPVTLSFSGTVAPDQPVGTLDVPARVRTTTNQDVTENDDTVVTLNVIADTDLSITKTSDVESVDLGDEIVFTLTVTNNGTSNSVTSTIVDEIPEGLVPTGVVDSGETCVIDGNTVTCSNPTIPADGGTYVVDITAQAIGNGAGVNIATVDCGCDDAVLAASGEVPYDIVRTSDLAITKTADTATAMAGQAVTYTITVTNAGPDTAVGVFVTDVLPSGLLFLSASPSTGTYNPSTGVWEIGDVAVGDTPTLLLVAQASGVGLVTNNASVDSDVTDPSAANNSDGAGVSISPVLIPATGSESSVWIRLGFASVLLGLGLWLLGRRRSSDAATAG